MQIAEDLDHLLEPYTPEVQQLARTARDLVLELMPEVIEQVDFPAHLIGYGLDYTYKGMVCGIALYRYYINIMFAQGAHLPDPDGLLQGMGKRARHVKITAAGELANPALPDLLRLALQAVQAGYSSSPKK